MSSSQAAQQRPRTRLVFSGMPAPIVTDLEEVMHRSTTHPLVGLEVVEVISHAEGIVFRLNEGAAGYSFCRNVWGAENDAQIFRHFLQDPVQSLYMHIPYEVKEQDEETFKDVARGILERYQNYGSQHAAKIDWLRYQKAPGKSLLILRVPKEILEAMMAAHGGLLTTTVRGTAAALRQVPVLAQIVPAEAKDEERLQRAFVTQYQGGAAEREQCLAVHQAAIREVVAAKDLGICIGPIAVWSP